MTRAGNERVSGRDGTRPPRRKSIGLWLRGLRVQSPSLTLFSENTEEIDEVAARFLSLIDRSGGPDSCWPWTGIIGDGGYGRFSFGGKIWRAHRLACMVAHGDPPAADSEAAHSQRCVTRACCNPNHLRWDSHDGNMADVAALGKQKGDRNPRAAITSEIAAAAWSRRHEGAVALSVEFGVPYAAIRAVLRGLSWTHITGASPEHIAPRRGRPRGRKTVARPAVLPALAALLFLSLGGGCGSRGDRSLSRSNVENCRALCAPRHVYECCGEQWCVCDSDQPDGGAR